VTRNDPLRVFVSAGEPSGDAHAAALVEALARRAEVRVNAIGGPRLEAAGARIVFPAGEVAVVGLSEALRALPALARAYVRTKRLWKRDRPDIFVPVDFPGFNLRLARLAFSLDVPVVYYIPPQVWAWGAGRVDVMKKTLAGAAVILPFEESIYRRKGIRVRYVGHPLVDSVRPRTDRASFRSAHGFAPDVPLVALLPGSRQHEVRRLLPAMVESFKRLKRRRPECRGAVGLADAIPERKASRLVRELGLNLPVLKGMTHDLVNASDVVLAASGTVTLEAAILGKPLVIIYATSRITYAVARRLVRTRHIGLVNLVAGERVAPEFVQDEVEPAVLAGELESLLFDRERRERAVQALDRVRAKLGGPGASDRAAEFVLEVAGEVGL